MSGDNNKVYVVPTGRVVVPTGRYVVPAGKVIIIVSLGRLSLVHTGRILSPGSKDLSRVGSNTKEGGKFKKAQDVELKFLNKERNEKLRKSLMTSNNVYFIASFIP
ncbi:hypothetical protein Tco_1022144, partial [Tanacetum coccineum]